MMCLESLRRFAIVIVQQAAKPFAALNLTSALTNFLSRFNDLMIEPLVVSFLMIMSQVFFNGIS